MKHYTFITTCTFKMQFTFPETEVELDSGGDMLTDFEPSDGALLALQRELTEFLREYYMIIEDSVDVSVDSDDLLGIDDGTEA